MSDTDTPADARAVQARLAEPFDPKEVKFKPQSVKGNRALAMPYVDARAIQDRLDAVLGVTGWQDEYDTLADGSVVCRLRVHVGGEWITKTDVGSPSEQPDGGDRLKAAFSDALKRAAVKFGVGRYLYRLPAQWVDYDPVKKQFTQTPPLPAPARPKAGPAPAAQPAPAAGGKTPPALPADGAELNRRVREYDAKLAGQRVCRAGALVQYVTAAGVKAGYPADLTKWAGPAIPFAVDAVKAFEADVRSPAAAGT